MVPTVDGIVGILAEHLPYLAPLKPGELQIKFEAEDKADKFTSLAVDFGVAEFCENVLTILVNSAARAEEIDLDLAEKARAPRAGIVERRTQRQRRLYVCFSNA